MFAKFLCRKDRRSAELHLKRILANSYKRHRYLTAEPCLLALRLVKVCDLEKRQDQ